MHHGLALRLYLVSAALIAAVGLNAARDLARSARDAPPRTSIVSPARPNPRRSPPHFARTADRRASSSKSRLGALGALHGAAAPTLPEIRPYPCNCDS